MHDCTLRQATSADEKKCLKSSQTIWSCRFITDVDLDVVLRVGACQLWGSFCWISRWWWPQSLLRGVYSRTVWWNKSTNKKVRCYKHPSSILINRCTLVTHFSRWIMNQLQGGLPMILTEILSVSSLSCTKLIITRKYLLKFVWNIINN